MTMRVCVIGAGPSGLATARRLRQQGMEDIIVYEQQFSLGGNWAWREGEGHASAYESARSISSKTLTALEDFPFPKGTQDYPTREELLRYLVAYAEHFHLLPSIRFNMPVQFIQQTGQGRWAVTTPSGTEVFDAVCICNGHHWKPHLPMLSGDFSGQILHSHDFRSSRPFANQKVLIIGCGNSGADIAVDIARHGGKVTLSTRRGYYLIPHFLFGMPSDLLYARLHWFVPEKVLRKIAAAFLRRRARHQGVPMPQPDHELFATHPLINSDLARFLVRKRIALCSEVTSCSGKTILFRDGTTDFFETILCCTGYEVCFPFLQADHYESPSQLLLRIASPSRQGLYFIGLIQPSGSIWPVADLQAHLVSLTLAGRLSPTILNEADSKLHSFPQNYVRTQRHALEVDIYRYTSLLRQCIRKQQG